MTRIIISVLTLALITSLWGQKASSLSGRNISIAPIAFGIHKTMAGTWHPEKQPVSFAGWGIQGETTYGRWHLFAEFINMRFFGLGNIPNRFSPEQGFSWQQHATDTQKEFDTDYSNFKLTYQVEGLSAFVGKFSPKWGPALHSIVISQKAPTYPQFGFEWKPNRRLRFIYTHADLFSGIEDTLQTQSAGLLGERVVHLKRYLATHRAEFSLTPLITLGLTESVVYGGRGMETMYLMPFVLYFSAEHYLGDRDNVLMSADLAVNLKPDLKLYAEFLVDEWRPQETFKETNRNWFAWQGGIDWQSILAPNDRFVLEATWTDHRIYRHRYSANEYYSHEYPVGHWIGPHAQALYAAYDFPFWGSHFMVSFNYAKRGELTKPMLEDQYSSMSYDRFSGKTETLQTINLTIDRKVLPKALPSLWVEIGVSHIRWSNAGFNPFKPEANELGDVTKTSYTLAFYYNFHIPGYDVSFLSPS